VEWILHFASHPQRITRKLKPMMRERQLPDYTGGTVQAELSADGA
jgi:hypothetical protein